MSLELLEDRRLLGGGSQDQAIQLLGDSPLLFVENRGQWPDESVRYAFHGSDVNVLLTDAGPVFQVLEREDGRDSTERETHQELPGEAVDAFHAPSEHAIPERDDLRTPVEQFSVEFTGAHTAVAVGLDQAETVYNYYVGDQANWRTGVPAFQKVTYRNLYDGIDLVSWGRRDGLKYEFHVAPGADWRTIRVSFEGIEGLRLDSAGALHVQTAAGEIVEQAPYLYQVIGDQIISVAGRFQLIDPQSYCFAVTGPYDARAELVIDPELDWGSFLGGSREDYSYAVTVDTDGNALIAGQTSSAGFPASGGFDTSLDGPGDAFVAKVTAAGQLAWASFLGGSSDDRAYGIAADTAGNALITGWTSSADFSTPGGFDPSYNGNGDAFVAKITAAGQLDWASFLGGNDDDKGSGITVDTEGNALVTGWTGSANFPTPGGFDRSLDGIYDVFVAKVSAAGQLDWASFLGGNADDYGHGIAADTAGNALVTGFTQSGNFPTPGGFDPSRNGEGYDAFVAKVTAAGQLAWASYLGGSDSDCGYGIAVDTVGDALITGETWSADFPTPGGFDPSSNGNGDAFVAKVTAAGQLAWASYLGGSDSDCGYGVAVDTAGDALITGWTGSDDFPTPGGFDPISNGGTWDTFVAKVTGAGQLAWASFLGGSRGDRGYGIAVDTADNIVVTGWTSSTDFPTPRGFDTSWNGGAWDVFVAKFHEPRSGIASRVVFYNHSAFDGNDPASDQQDDRAIAWEKRALLPGQTATFANYTSYSRGINGIMVDIAGLAGKPTAADFVFGLGDGDGNPAGWTDAPAPSSVTVRQGAGVYRSNRVTLVWPDGAIKNRWLQVTVLANANTALAQDDVFYFGNAIGETGNSASDARVDAVDVLLARNNPRTFLRPASIESPYDFNRDGLVNATDVLIARNNQTNPATALKLIRVPSNKTASRKDLLSNGGLETGDFQGWTATTNGQAELTPWPVGPAGGGFFFNSQPLEGRYSAYNGFDGMAGLEYELYRDVFIPADVTRVELTTRHRIVYTPAPRMLTISLRGTDNALLATLYTETIPLMRLPESDRGWNTRVFDLTTYAGQTVRLHFRESILATFAGPAMIEFDDIRLTAWVRDGGKGGTRLPADAGTTNGDHGGGENTEKRKERAAGCQSRVLTLVPPVQLSSVFSVPPWRKEGLSDLP